MSDADARNSIAFRISQVERRVDKLEDGQPFVVAERVGMLSLRLQELRVEFAQDIAALQVEMRQRDEAREKQIRGFQRIFVTVFSGVGIAVAVAIIAQIATGGGP